MRFSAYLAHQISCLRRDSPLARAPQAEGKETLLCSKAPALSHSKALEQEELLGRAAVGSNTWTPHSHINSQVSKQLLQTLSTKAAGCRGHDPPLLGEKPDLPFVTEELAQSSYSLFWWGPKAITWLQHQFSPGKHEPLPSLAPTPEGRRSRTGARWVPEHTVSAAAPAWYPSPPHARSPSQWS